MINSNEIEAKRTLPKTIIVEGNGSSFPNKPARPNKKTARCISIRLLVFCFIVLNQIFKINKASL